MKNLKYIMATLMVALIVAVVCVACNKDKETPIQEANNNSDNEPNTEVVERKPIATMDTKTGKFVYLFTVEELQNKLDRINDSKGENSNSIIESIEIERSLTKDSDKSVLCISIINTDTEVSSKGFFNCGFLQQIEENGEIFYFISDDVLEGNYSTIFRGTEGTFELTISDNEIVNINPVNDSIIDRDVLPKTFVKCEALNCRQGGCMPVYDSHGDPYDCTACGVPADEYHWCHKTSISIGSGNLSDWLGLLRYLFK